MLSASSRSRWVRLVAIGEPLCPLRAQLVTCGQRCSAPTARQHLSGDRTDDDDPLLPCLAAAVALGPAAAPQKRPSRSRRADFIKNIDAHFADDGHQPRRKLSAAELSAEAAARAAAGEGRRSSRRLEAKFQQLDTNHDGQFSLAEFLAAIRNIQMQRERADQSSQQLDTNHDGKVSADEFRAPRRREVRQGSTQPRRDRHARRSTPGKRRRNSGLARGRGASLRTSLPWGAAVQAAERRQCAATHRT